jgi:CheY-like chemotaxis protein
MTSAPGVPVIIQTGRNDEELARSALRRGAHDFLVKGRFDGRMLYSAIKYAVDRNTLFQRIAGINQSILELERDRVVQDTVNEAVYALSQPLTILTILASEMVKELKPGERHFDTVSKMCEATDRLNRIVRDMGGKRKQSIKTYPGEVQVLDFSHGIPVMEQQPAAARAVAPPPPSPAIAAKPIAPPRPVAAVTPAPRAVAAPVTTTGPARMEL